MIIYTSFKCNMNCSFCMNRHLLPNISNTLSIDLLKNFVQQYPNLFKNCVVIGGEVSLLPKSYLSEIIYTLAKNESEIEVITNGSNDLNTSLDLPDYVKLTVSYDFHYRQNHIQTLKNIVNCKRDIQINTILSKELFDVIGLQQLRKISTFGNVRNIYLFPVVPFNDSDLHRPSEEQMEQIVDLCNIDRKFKFTGNIEPLSFEDRHNIDQLFDHIIGNTLILLPNGKFSYIWATENLDTIHECLQAIKLHLQKFIQNDYCHDCEFLGCCFTSMRLNSPCDGYPNAMRKLVYG